MSARQGQSPADTLFYQALIASSRSPSLALLMFGWRLIARRVRALAQEAGGPCGS